MTTTSGITAPGNAVGRAHVLLLPLLAFSQFISAIDYNIVVVALPDIASDLGFSAGSLQWVVSAYALAFGGLLLFGGRASDLLGRRRILILGLAMYGASSLLGALATDPGVLLAARGLQGVGGALLVPAVLATLTVSFAEGRARNRAFVTWSIAGGVGLAAGSLLGGVLTSAFGWPAVFLVNVPLVAVALIAAVVAMPADPPRDRSRALSIPSAILVTGGVVLVVFGLVEGPASGWLSPVVLGALLGGVALVAFFVALQARSEDPLMPLHLLRNRSTAAAMATAFLFMGGVGTMYYLFSVYLQDGLGLDALQSGLAFLPWALVAVLASPLANRILDRFGVRTSLIAGMLVAALGVAILAVGMVPDGEYWLALPGIVVLGAGQAMGFAALFLAAGSGVSASEQGVASALVSTIQQIGAAVGLAVLVGLAIAVDGAGNGSAVPGLQAAAFGAAVLLALGAVAPLVMRRSQMRQG